MKRSFVNIFKRFRSLAISYDPKAIIGFEGAGVLQQGPDFENLLHINGFWCTYNDPAFEVICGLADKKFIVGKWTGYTKDAENLIGYAWENVIKGANSLWWWRWDGLGKFRGLIKSSLEFSPDRKLFIDEIRILREGLGDLLVHSNRADDGIAILYSDISRAASTCMDYEQSEDGKSGAYSFSHQALTKALRNLGLGFRYVTDKMLENGILKQHHIKMLFLPMACGISDETADVIREFVKNGGVVIADVKPGVFDGYCKRRKRAVLDDLFDTGQKKSKQPISKINRFGRGLALLLNSAFNEHPQSTLKAIRTLLQRIKIEQPITLQTSDIEIARWQAGNIEIVGFLNPQEDSEKAIVKLNRNAFVYSLQSTKQFGNVCLFKVMIPANRARFFALAPYPLDIPKIIIPKNIQRGKSAEIIMRFSKQGHGGIRSVYFKLEKPDGKFASWSQRTVLSDRKGSIRYVWTPAYEDQLGTWKLHAKLVLQNKDIIIPFILKSTQ